MTGHTLLQVMPARSWWVGCCTCGWTTPLVAGRERAAELVDQHALDATLGPDEHVDPKDKQPTAPGPA